MEDTIIVYIFFVPGILVVLFFALRAMTVKNTYIPTAQIIFFKSDRSKHVTRDLLEKEWFNNLKGIRNKHGIHDLTVTSLNWEGLPVVCLTLSDPQILLRFKYFISFQALYTESFGYNLDLVYVPEMSERFFHGENYFEKFSDDFDKWPLVHQNTVLNRKNYLKEVIIQTVDTTAYRLGLNPKIYTPEGSKAKGRH